MRAPSPAERVFSALLLLVLLLVLVLVVVVVVVVVDGAVAAAGAVLLLVFTCDIHGRALCLYDFSALVGHLCWSLGTCWC